MVKEYSHEELERMRIAMQGESAWDKMKRKSKEEPLVPAGKNHEMAPHPPTFTLMDDAHSRHGYEQVWL